MNIIYPDDHEQYKISLYQHLNIDYPYFNIVISYDLKYFWSEY